MAIISLRRRRRERERDRKGGMRGREDERMRVRERGRMEESATSLLVWPRSWSRHSNAHDCQVFPMSGVQCCALEVMVCQSFSLNNHEQSTHLRSILAFFSAFDNGWCGSKKAFGKTYLKGKQQSKSSFRLVLARDLPNTNTDFVHFSSILLFLLALLVLSSEITTPLFIYISLSMFVSYLSSSLHRHECFCLTSVCCFLCISLCGCV